MCYVGKVSETENSGNIRYWFSKLISTTDPNELKATNIIIETTVLWKSKIHIYIFTLDILHLFHFSCILRAFAKDHKNPDWDRTDSWSHSLRRNAYKPTWIYSQRSWGILLERHRSSSLFIKYRFSLYPIGVHVGKLKSIDSRERERESRPFLCISSGIPFCTALWFNFENRRNHLEQE